MIHNCHKPLWVQQRPAWLFFYYLFFLSRFSTKMLLLLFAFLPQSCDLFKFCFKQRWQRLLLPVWLYIEFQICLFALKS